MLTVKFLNLSFFEPEVLELLGSSLVARTEPNKTPDLAPQALRSRSASPALLGAQSEAGAVGQGTTVAAVERVPEVTAVGRGQNPKSITTMASAAKVLLARREDGERPGGPFSPSPPPAAALQDPSSKKSAVAGRRNPPTAEVDELVDSNNLSIVRGGEDKAETQLSRWCVSSRFEGRPDGAPRILNGSNARGKLIVGQYSTGESPERNERRSESRRVSPGGESVEQPPQPDAIASPGVCALATAAVTLVDGRPATGQQQLYTPQQGGVRWDVGTIGSGTAGTAAEQGEVGSAEGEVRAGDHHGSTSEATRRLLREALRVKRVLAEMDKADATRSAIDNGLGDEDPEKFLASLGLVELKPLSARLVEALERAPRPLLGDPSVAVPEPRTTRGLRDQVRNAACLCALCVVLSYFCAEVPKHEVHLVRCHPSSPYTSNIRQIPFPGRALTMFWENVGRKFHTSVFRSIKQQPSGALVRHLYSMPPEPDPYQPKRIH